jgi:Flp pilus assembly protein TadG
MSAATGRAQRRSLVADRDGTAAVEFALLFPIMLTLFIGTYEVENVLLADLKLTAAAETAADLVAQTTITGGSAGTGVLQSQDFTTFASAAADVLTPLPTGADNSLVKIAFTLVTYSTGTPVIDWHVEENNATAISLANIPNNETLTNLGNAAVNSPDSVIIVQVQYTYTSPISYVLSSSYTLSESAFNRPRYVTCVPTNPASVTHSSDTNGVCP